MEKVSREIFREEELSDTVRGFPVLYGKFRKWFKEIDAVKNAWMESKLEFIQTSNYFYFNLFHFLKLSHS